MSLASFKKLMTHTLTLRKRQRNSSGDFSDISSVVVKGFVEYGNKLITTAKGEEVKATAIVYLKDDCGIDISWEYWMIDQSSPYIRNNMEVLTIDPVDDPRTGNTHHYECGVR